MITIGMNYDVFPDKEKLFTEKFKEVIELLNKTENHLNSRLYKDEYSSTPSFLVISEWETRDAFLSFIKSDIFRQVTDWGKDGILSDRPRHKVYQTEKLEKPSGNN